MKFHSLQCIDIVEVNVVFCFVVLYLHDILGTLKIYVHHLTAILHVTFSSLVLQRQASHAH